MYSYVLSSTLISGFIDLIFKEWRVVSLVNANADNVKQLCKTSE